MTQRETAKGARDSRASCDVAAYAETRSLTDESLLTDGAWIDDATKRLVSA